jgi:cation transport regulator ChaB
MNTKIETTAVQEPDRDDRRAGTTREETAHKVAWAAVKNVYEKNTKTGKWEPITSKV